MILFGDMIAPKALNYSCVVTVLYFSQLLVKMRLFYSRSSSGHVDCANIQDYGYFMAKRGSESSVSLFGAYFIDYVINSTGYFVDIQ